MVFLVREMQIGLRQAFEYGRCDRCGAITRLSKVTELSRFYPSHYYSFLPVRSHPKRTGFAEWLRKRRDRCLLRHRMDPLGKFLDWVSGGGTTFLYRLIGKSRIELSSRVLDVGCGSGNLLHRMAEIGFQNLFGVDLFFPGASPPSAENPRIIKGDLSSVQGQQFDLIMMHHYFEHSENPFVQLKLVRNLLCPGGVLLIRQPLCDGEAFQRYGANWVQLDAPRHAALHSLASMKRLVEKSGMKIQKIVWDSTDQQFWASEQYLNDIPMYAEESYLCNPKKAPFTSEQICSWQREAKILNSCGSGDQGAFFIEVA
jgi:SAM-dependent methyltransferase